MSDFSWSESWRIQKLRDDVERLRTRVKSDSFSSAEDLRSVLASIDQLEVDLGRSLLKIHTLSEVLQAKGIVTAEELAAKSAELDALDGHADGGLHPSLFRTDEECRRTPSPRAFLVALEKEDLRVNPKDFLRQLEERERAAE